MTTRLRAAVLPAVLAVVALGLTACRGVPAPEVRVLRVLMTDDWVTAPFIDAVRAFERRHPDVRIIVDRSPISRIADAVRAGISSGAPPDVVQGHAYSAASLGLAQPLGDLWASTLTDGEFLPGAIEDVTWVGERYGVPLDTNAMAVIYNVEHFESAGLSPPGPDTTFTEFEALARALTTSDGARRGLAVTLSNWTTAGWIRANGGELASATSEGQPQLTLDDPRAVDALGFLARLVRDGVAFGPEPVDARSADAFALFQSGRASMHTSGSWDLVQARRLATQGRWGVALMPVGATGQRGTVIGGSSLWIPVGSPQRSLAFEFMIHLTSDLYALRFAVEEGRLPARPRLFADPSLADPQLRVFFEQLLSARPSILGAFHEASTAFEQALVRILIDGADAGLALGEAQRAASEAEKPR